MVEQLYRLLYSLHQAEIFPDYDTRSSVPFALIWRDNINVQQDLILL